MHNQKDQNNSRWSQHLFLLAALLTMGGIALIVLSENGLAVFAIGGTAILVAHITAFAGLLTLGGGGLSKLIKHLWQTPTQKKER